jgi:drug/metabolite transporter (DMT)-like permease
LVEQDGRLGAANGSQTGGYLGVILAAACWASSGILINFIAAASDVSALALAFWRDLVTFTLLLGGLGLLRPAWLRVARRDLKWLAGLGGVGLGAFHVMWNANVVLNGVAVATVQQAAMPAIVAVAARLLWHEPMTLRKVAAIVLTFAGTVLVSGIGSLETMSLTAPAILLGVGTPVAYAAYNLFGKPMANRYPPVTVLTYGFGFASLMLLPFQLLTPQPWPVPHSSWLWFALLIVFATILPFIAYTAALGRLSAGVAGILAMAEIPFAALYANVLLGEQLVALQWAGAILVVCGVLLLTGKNWSLVTVRGKRRQPRR